MTQPNQSELNMNQIEAIISDHNKEMRKDIAAEITGDTRSASITNVVTAKAIQAHVNAEVAKVLDRLGDQSVTVLPETYPTGSRTSIDAVPLEAIQAERALIEKRMT